jgi:hypothetical protein
MNSLTTLDPSAASAVTYTCRPFALTAIADPRPPVIASAGITIGVSVPPAPMLYSQTRAGVRDGAPPPRVWPGEGTPRNSQRSREADSAHEQAASLRTLLYT